MAAVTVSPKYQIVIPKEIREAYKIKPGQKWAWVDFGGSIRLVRVRPIKEMRGMCKGMPNDFDREPDREL